MEWSASNGDPIVFWILRFFLLFVFIVCGRKMYTNERIVYKKTNLSYMMLATVIALAYSLIEGLRWLRGYDYYAYMQHFIHGSKNASYKLDFLYSLWIDFFHSMGLPFWLGFVFYSFILIVAYLFLLQDFKKTALITLPVFFIITVMPAENLIRQYFSSSFLIFSYVFFIKKKYIYIYLCALISCLIHFSAIIPCLFMLIFINVKINLKTPWILIFVFIGLFLFWRNEYFYFVSEFINKYNFIDLNGKSYAENSDRWFTIEGSIAQYTDVNYIHRYSKFLCYLFLIYSFFELQKKDFKLQCIYYMSYMAMICDILGSEIEMYRRFYNWFLLFLPLMIGLIFTSNSFSSLKQPIKIIIIVIFVIYYLYYCFLSTMFILMPTGYAFIWDK